MARGKAICIEIRKLIIKDFLNKNKSFGDIAKKYNLSKPTVQSIIKSYKNTGSIRPKQQRHGRTSSLTTRDIRQLERLIKTERRLTVRSLASEWSEKIGKPVGREWTRLHARRLNYKFYKAKKKPLLTSVQKLKRIKWAKERQCWDQRKWNSIVFSDESKFEVTVGNGRSRVLRKSTEAFHPDCIDRRVKAAASLMVWGCMSAEGVGKLKFIDGTVNANKYVEILEQNLFPSVAPWACANDFIFQQDGAPPHTAKITKNWLQNNNINVLDWPSSSPDLNPIEALWGIMKRRLRNSPQRTLAGLKTKIQEIWDSITEEECQKLIKTMPYRISEVIKSKGDVTKY